MHFSVCLTEENFAENLRRHIRQRKKAGTNRPFFFSYKKKKYESLILGSSLKKLKIKLSLPMPTYFRRFHFPLRAAAERPSARAYAASPDGRTDFIAFSPSARAYAARLSSCKNKGQHADRKEARSRSYLCAEILTRWRPL